MATNAGRRASEQMRRDGIRKLSRWSKPRPGNGCTVQDAVELPRCGHPLCGKRAGYSTPRGSRCFTHARASVSGEQ